MFTEDRKRDRASFFPTIVNELLKNLKCKECILDGEIVEYSEEVINPKGKHLWDKFKQLDREEMIKWVVGKKKPDDSRVALNLYDIFYVDGKDLTKEGYDTRYRILREVYPKDTQHVHVTETKLAHNFEEFRKYLWWAATYPNSEGAVVKTEDAKYRWSGRTPEFAKLKNLKEIDVIVYKVHQQVKEGKPIDVYYYECAFKVPEKKLKEFDPKRIVEVKGRKYVAIGRSYATKVKCKVGDIVTVAPVKIEINETPKGKVVTWTFPKFVMKRPDKDEPDPLDVVEKIAALGTAAMKFNLEALRYIPLYPCPFVDTPLCPFKDKFAHLEKYVFYRLKYPINCPYARVFRCMLVKPYYYERVVFDEKMQFLEKDKGDKEEKVEFPSGLIPVYLEYPSKQPSKYVIQFHLRSPKLNDLTKEEIKTLLKAKTEDLLNPKGKLKQILEKTSGASVHEDFRLQVDDHLVGYTIVGERWGDPCEIKFRPNEPKRRLRVEMKAPQPLAWLAVEGYVPPREVAKSEGEVAIGSTRYGAGLFIIRDTGKVWFGALKPYFREYFLDGKEFKRTRVVVRGTKARRLDPVTKKPLPFEEILWMIMVPEDQEPYAVSKRAREKEWIPPEGVIPIPDWWIKEHPKEFEEWKKWVEEVREKRKRLEVDWGDEVEGEFVVHKNSWKGQTVIRNMPKVQYYLRLKIGDKVESFIFENNPIMYATQMGLYEGKVRKKWFDYEGEVEPLTEYNPNKKIKTKMEILDRGKFTLRKGKLGKIEVWHFQFKGKKLKGSVIAMQEEKDSDVFTFEKKKVKLQADKFVYDEHIVNNRPHWDLRIKSGDLSFEFNLYEDLIPKEKEQAIRAIFKQGVPDEWFEDQEIGSIKVRRVGNLDTEVKRLDQGECVLLDFKDNFISFNLFGRKLKGYFVARKDGGWKVWKSTLPEPSRLEEDPLEGKAYSKPKWEEHRDFYFVWLYDPKEFSRAVENPDEYLKVDKPDWLLDLLLGLYAVPGTVHHVRVMGLKVAKDVDKDEVEKWIRENKLMDFVSQQKRG